MEISKILNAYLTEDQRDAVTDPNNELLCLACAGSGKSRTLAYRIAYLIATNNPPNSIVAFTFTEKAAESLKRRVSEALFQFGLPPTYVGAMYIGTIHSFCQFLLGTVNAKYRQFEVLDENGLKLYLLSRYYQLGLSKIKSERSSGMFKTIIEISNAWSIANEEGISFEEIKKSDETLGEILEKINTSLNQDQFIDFSLMIRLAVDELEKKNKKLHESLNNYNHIFVDEYQDINPIQEKLITLLHHHSDSLMVVGDDDQSIYSWRGADVTNILSFQERYPNSKMHILNRNFRSTSKIVKTSDDFIQQELSSERYSKKPVSNNDGNANDFQSLWFDTREDEANWVARRIHELIGTKYIEYNPDGTVKEIRGLTKADFAILFRSIRRSVNPQGLPNKHFEFTNELKKLGIYYTLESEGGIFDRPHARAIRSTMELLRTQAPSREDTKKHFTEIIIPYFPNADFVKLSTILSNWNVLIHTPPGGARRKVYPQELLHQLLDSFGVSQTEFDDSVLRDLGVFSSIILDIEKVFVSIDSSRRFNDMLNFLSNVAESGYDLCTLDIIAKPDAVTVSTIHKMKGLEFPVVFIVDVVNRRFPADKSNYRGWLPNSVMQDSLSRGSYCTKRQDEARLFYTAMTRAERFLYITGASIQPDTQKDKKPSVFKLRVNEILNQENSYELTKDVEKTAQKRRIDETLLPTSFSDIKEYLVCPMAYKLKNLFGFNPAVPELFGFGQTTHTIIERLHQQYKTKSPSDDEIVETVNDTFHLKHIFPSRNPDTNPGPYERAQRSAEEIVKNYVENFSSDFERIREDEVRFEINVGQALVSGSIDLLLKHDDTGKIVSAEVIDFKTMNSPDNQNPTNWIDLSLQVQLYAYAANAVLGENAKTGSVHLLKEIGKDARINVPISKDAIDAAIENISWAVDRILENDFPMRPYPEKCEKCDVHRICRKIPQRFASNQIPQNIHIPTDTGNISIRAFSEFSNN